VSGPLNDFNTKYYYSSTLECYSGGSDSSELADDRRFIQHVLASVKPSSQRQRDAEMNNLRLLSILMGTFYSRTPLKRPFDDGTVY